ncbi:hypothetical protein ADICYQ_2641 [Cyclobacterium qasimii M12-11B]|uniref:Uncharacterized protein n=2 Tax=Cyclobacterium qasimii TaxID=1350429 RepID=S7WNQ3_9BACT|nr:hypothetical protein ADICYQ_2641 [Cyclobacterium qasimii M12-11B]GEO23603.1 hypothetical protein CQA01_41370 [Cyclobacterium qasimii]
MVCDFVSIVAEKIAIIPLKSYGLNYVPRVLQAVIEVETLQDFFETEFKMFPFYLVRVEKMLTYLALNDTLLMHSFYPYIQHIS